MPSISLAPFFPVGPTYAGEAICSDEKYIYVRVVDIGTGAHYVNALDLTGTIKPGWPPLGTLLPGVGGSPLTPPSYCGNLIVAQLDGGEQYATRLVSLNEWASGASGLMVTVLNATNGAIVASGDGDIPTLPGPFVPANCYPQGGLVSDGGRVYFTWKDSTGTGGGIGTALINNPALGSGYATMPYAIPSADCNQLIYDGSCVWYFDWTGDIYIFRRLEDTMDLKTGAAVIGSAKFAAFDGLNIWMQDLEAANSSWQLLKIPAMSVAAVGSGGQGLASMINGGAGMMQLSEAGTVPASQVGKMCFDGDSVWMIMTTVGGVAVSGKLRRVPRAGLR